MSNQQQTKQQKNALRHVGATAPPRPNCMETEEEKKLNLFLPQVLYTNKMSMQTGNKVKTMNQEEKQKKNALRHEGATAPPAPKKKEEKQTDKQTDKQTKMVSYQEQLAKCKSSTEEYNTIWKNKEWTIKDYEDLFADIERGYIIQGDFDTHHNYFIINPAFEE